MTLDLAYLLDFKALVETGSFSRAASIRNVTQPAFSRRIRALEDWTGTPLFHRGSTPVTLTQAGQAIAPAFETGLRALMQGQADARAAAARARSASKGAASARAFASPVTRARSRAAGSVRAATPPFEAA